MQHGYAAALAAVAVSLVGGAVAAERACNVTVNVSDQDPKGMNVRAAPGGAVVGALKAKERWVELHIVGQDGDWMRFDKATLYDDALPDGEGPLQPARGWANVGKLGVESFAANAEIRAEPRQGSRLLRTAGPSPDSEPAPMVLGCSGDWLQVRWKGTVGWTRGTCTNQYTTCS